jgi:hypothetical protein
MQSEVRPVAHQAARALAAERAASPKRRPAKKQVPPPAAPEAQPIPLLTVMSSCVATSSDEAAVALVLRTEEAGRVGFQLTIETCAVLRCQIAIAEAVLRQKPRTIGQADAERVCREEARDERSRQRSRPRSFGRAAHAEFSRTSA